MTNRSRHGQGLWRIDVAGAAACAFVTLLAYLLVLGPRLQTAHRHTEQADLLAHALSEEARMESRIDTRRSDLAEVQHELAAAPTRLRPVGEINQQLALLNTLAAAHGIEIEQIELGRTDRQADFATVEIKFVGRGSFPSVTRFIHQMNESMPNTALLRFDVSRDMQSPGSQAVFVSNLAWYAASGRDVVGMVGP